MNPYHSDKERDSNPSRAHTRSVASTYMHERGDKEPRGVDEGSRVGEQTEQGGSPNDTKRREKKKKKKRKKETRERMEHVLLSELERGWTVIGEAQSPENCNREVKNEIARRSG